MGKKKPPLILCGKDEAIQFKELLPTLNPNYRPVVLSFGAGFDSIALWHWYISVSDEERGFPLENLILIHAVVGGEGDKVKEIMEEAVLPVCREKGIWVIQAHRNGDVEGDGVTILSSTRSPKNFYQRGSYSLFPYTIMSGSLPQKAGGSRLCTMKFKAWVVDGLVRALFGDSPLDRIIGYNGDEHGRAYKDKGTWNVAQTPIYDISYNADEVGRTKRDRSMIDKLDQGYNYLIGYDADESSRAKGGECESRQQVFRFPLIEKRFGRAWVEARVNGFLIEYTNGRITTGKKSYCENLCPFPDCNGRKRSHGNNTTTDLRQDWLDNPLYGAEAAFAEYISLGLNIEQPLYSKKSPVIDILAESGNTKAIAIFQQMLDGQHWPELVIPLLKKVAERYPLALPQAEGLEQGKAWAVYSIRRIFPKGEQVRRQTRILRQEQSRQPCMDYLAELAARYGKEIETIALSPRFFSVPRPLDAVETATGKIKLVKPKDRSYVEEQFVVLPACPYPKQAKRKVSFEFLWAEITGDIPRIVGEENHVKKISFTSTSTTRKARRSRSSRFPCDTGNPG